jgi:hypothetical protein
MSNWWHTNTAIMEESLGDPCEQIRCYRTRRDRSPSGCATRARRRSRLTAIIEASERHAVSGRAVADTSAGRRSLKRASDTPCLVAPWLTRARRSRHTAIIEASERHAVSGSAVAALWQGSPRGYRQGALLSQRPWCARRSWKRACDTSGDPCHCS